MSCKKYSHSKGYWNIYRDLGIYRRLFIGSAYSSHGVLHRHLHPATIARARANGREIEGERMSDRPRARTWYTLEANLPESFFTAQVRVAKARPYLSGRYFAKLKNYPRIYLPYLPQLKEMRRERNGATGGCREEWKG